MSNHISTSQIKSYLRCGMAYRLHYIEKIPTVTNGFLLSGKVYHEAVAIYLREKLKTKIDMPSEWLVTQFERTWKSVKEVEVKINYGKETEEELKDSSIRCLRLLREKVLTAISPIVVEEPFILPLQVNGKAWKHELFGVIDCVANNGPEGVRILDWKLTKRCTNQEAIDSDIQLSCYSLAWRSLMKKKESQVSCVLGIRTKEVKHQVVDSTRTDEQLQSFLRLLGGVSHGIDSGVFLPVNDPMKCNYCEYKNICKKY